MMDLQSRVARTPRFRVAPYDCPPFTHRDVGNTDCPGNAALRCDGRDPGQEHISTNPPEPIKALEGGATYQRWQLGGG